MNLEPFSLYSPVDCPDKVLYVAEDDRIFYFRAKIVNSILMRPFQCLSLFGFLFLFLVGSCKKEEEKGSCFDGVLSPGELGIDCGGVCPPCQSGNTLQEILLVQLNGKPMQFLNKTLEYEGGWILNFWNDTVNIRLNFGEISEVGIQPIIQPYSSVLSNSQLFEDLYDGFVLVADIHQADNRLTGFFEAKLVGYFLDSMIVDTFYIKNGDFENIVMSQ